MKISSDVKNMNADAQNFEFLRFDEGELNDIRNGFLSPAVRARFKQRLKNFGKIMRIIYSVTAVVFLLLVAPFACFFGYSFYAISHTPKAVVVFLIFFVACFVAGIIAAVFVWRRFMNKVGRDLNGMRVNCEQGRIKIVVTTTRNNHTVKYSVGAMEFKVLEDFIGAEIHKDLLGGVFFRQSTESREDYRVYYLPESKMILHYEKCAG